MSSNKKCFAYGKFLLVTKARLPSFDFWLAFALVLTEVSVEGAKKQITQC